MSDLPGNSEPAPEVQFNVEVDAEAELEEMRRHVDRLQEDLQLKTLHDSAARDEGTRKTVVNAQAAAKMNTSVFVGGLNLRTTEDDLRVFFTSCGTVSRLTMLKDRFSGQPKGTAYIEFETPEQANSAILKDGQSLHGKPLKIAPKRENIPAFQRGGRGMAPGGFPSRGRGGNPLQQQMAAMAMMATMMGGNMGFNPYGAPRGRGRGRGRGTH